MATKACSSRYGMIMLCNNAPHNLKLNLWYKLSSPKRFHLDYEMFAKIFQKIVKIKMPTLKILDYVFFSLYVWWVEYAKEEN